MSNPAQQSGEEPASLRVPPHSIEAEQSVLGGLLLDNSAWDRAADLLRESDFYRYEHRLIYAAVGTLVAATKPVDVVTVFEQLQMLGKADACGGIAYLNALAQSVPSASNIRRYAEIVREGAILRKLIGASDDIATKAFNPQGRTVAQILDEAEGRVFAIGEEGSRAQQGLQGIDKLVVQLIDRVTELQEKGAAEVTGVRTGFYDLDRMTSGLQPGELIILAARPAMGKTSLALNIAEHVAVQENLPVAVFSMEMGASQLALRLVGSLGRIDQQHLRTGALRDDEWTRLTDAVDKLARAALVIDESPALNPAEVRARSRRQARQCGKLALIVVDYLQLMSGTSSGEENRATELGEVSRALKSLAKELQCPVIALSQLNRSVEARHDKRPMMSDLRECVTGGTLVWLADGRRVPIAGLVGQKPMVLAVGSHERMVRAQADRVWEVGARPVLRLNLSSGRSLRATAEHRVLGANGWRTMGDLRPGDRVATARKVPQPAAVSSWSEHELAQLIGDGSFVRGQAMRFTAAREDNGRAVAESARAFGSTAALRAARGQGASDGRTPHFDLPQLRDMLRDCALRLGSAKFMARAESDLVWDQVVSVENAGAELVYDLTVPGPACWLADGIVTHNSGALEQDADVIMFIYRDDYYDKESREPGVAELIIAKQRNGPVGTVKLAFLKPHTRFENLAAGSDGGSFSG